MWATERPGTLPAPDPARVQDWLARWREHHRSSPEMYHFVDPMLAAGLSFLDGEPIAGKRLLEVGCGCGKKTRALAALGFRVVGMDIDPGALRGACERERLSVVRGDAAHLPFADESFDVTVSISVMQYAGWRASMREVQRVLALGGLAIFVENLYGNPLAQAYRTLRRLARWVPPSNQVPREYIRWDDAEAMAFPGAAAFVMADHLVAPLAYWRTILRPPTGGGDLDVGSGRFCRALARVDAALLRRAPALRRMCWHGLLCFRKPAATEPRDRPAPVLYPHVVEPAGVPLPQPA